MLSLRDFEEPLNFLCSIVPLILFAIVCVYLLYSLAQRWHSLPLPPGPKGSLITGNLSEVLGAVRERQQHLLFNKWAQQYGEIVRVRSGPFVQYFINSDQAVKEIFDKNSSITSQRPRWIASSEQICNKLNLLLLDADDPRWNHQRKITHTYLTSVPRADVGLAFLHFESAKFLYQMAQESDVSSVSGWKLYRRILRYTYSTFSSQTFGMDIPNDDDQVIADIHETGLAQILQTLPGANIIDVLPFLDKLPLFLKPWERRNRQRFQRDMRFVKEKLDRIERLRREGRINDAFLPLIESEGKGDEFGAGIDEAAYLSLMLVIGAADTSAVSTWTFLQAMLMFPEVQRIGREAIVSVVGNRIPVYEDMEQIPYVRCLMKETWRWRPPVALGHPHITTKELTYNGMRLPMGSQIHLNTFAVQHNPARYADPASFVPDRFKDDNLSTMQHINMKDVSKRDHFVFGAGRRVCPGYHVAERSLAIAIMRILWAFEVVPSVDAKLPLDPLEFEGEAMPGVADKRMPVSLRLVSEARRPDIEAAFRAVSMNRDNLEPLVHADGTGAFEELPFVKHENH